MLLRQNKFHQKSCWSSLLASARQSPFSSPPAYSWKRFACIPLLLSKGQWEQGIIQSRMWFLFCTLTLLCNPWPLVPPNVLGVKGFSFKPSVGECDSTDHIWSQPVEGTDSGDITVSNTLINLCIPHSNPKHTSASHTAAQGGYKPRRSPMQNSFWIYILNSSCMTTTSVTDP